MKNLEKIRKRKKMTREDVASKSKMSYAAIRAFEKGIREPKAKNALKIAAVLGTTVEELFGVPIEDLRK